MSASKINPVRKNMSMPAVSLPTAIFLFNAASIALVVGAVLVLSGTIGTVWMGLVKERYGDERIAANEERTAVANSDAAKANERAAVLEKQTEELRRGNLEMTRQLENERAGRLAIERKIGPRQLTDDQADALRSALASWPANLPATVTLLGDQEAAAFGSRIVEIFERAGVSIQIRRAGMLSPPPYGIIIVADRDGLLASVFSVARIETVSAGGQGATSFIVGLKPQ